MSVCLRAAVRSILAIFITAVVLAATPLQAQTNSAVATSEAPSVQESVRVLLSPKRYTTLAAEIGARIEQLPVAEALAFSAGDLLISFECSSQLAQLARSRAALEVARKTLVANERMLQLNAIGQLELDVARSEVDKAAAETRLYESVISKCRITAPFSGRVVEQKVREQQFVQPGQMMLEILDDSLLELEFIVPSRWLGWLRAGQSFKVRIDETGRSYPAHVLRIGAKVDPVSQSIKIVGAVDGKFSELLAGMSGRASFAPMRR